MTFSRDLIFATLNQRWMQRWDYIFTPLSASSPVAFTAREHLCLPDGGSTSLLLPLSLTARFCDSPLYRATSGLSMNMA